MPVFGKTTCIQFLLLGIRALRSSVFILVHDDLGHINPLPFFSINACSTHDFFIPLFFTASLSTQNYLFMRFLAVDILKIEIKVSRNQ